MPRHHKDWLTAYLTYCQHSEAPNHFHFWTGVSTIAGALRRRVWVDQVYFQWVPNFYIFLIGPPGIVTKSTTINIGYSLLSEIDVALGAQISTWQALIKELSEAQQLVEIRPAVFKPMCALSISVSELGTFLDTQDQRLLDLLTDLWDGQLGSTKKSTITQGNYVVENPWLNIIGCTTPSWLRKSVDESLMTGGLASRAIWLYSDRKRQLIAYPSKYARAMTVGAMQHLHGTLKEDLEQIAKLVGEYTLTVEAETWGEKWYAEHYNKVQRSNGAGVDDSLSGYISRKQTHIHKLAMILAASESDRLELTAEHLQKAEMILDVVEQGLPQVYSIIRQTARTQLAAKIVEVVFTRKAIQVSELYENMMSTVEYGDFRQALDAAVASGRVKIRIQGTATWLSTK